MSLSKLDEAKRSGATVVEVAMDEVRGIVFGAKSQCIGTVGLGGCSSVLIVSIYGAILAHIPPRPKDSDPTDISAGDRHVQVKMNEVVQLYTRFQSYFPTNTQSWVVCAVFQNNLALPDQQQIMCESLECLGLRVDKPDICGGRRHAVS